MRESDNIAKGRAAMIASGTGVELEPNPIEPDWVHDGSPQARSRLLSRSADGLAMTMEWDCTAGEFEWHYDIDETIYLLEGSALIGDGHSPPRRFGPGDVIFFQQGTVAHWQVNSYVRKVAFWRRPVPKAVGLGLRAGTKLQRAVQTYCSLRMLGRFLVATGKFAIGLDQPLPEPRQQRPFAPRPSERG